MTIAFGLLPFIFLVAMWITLAARGRMIFATIASWIVFGLIGAISTEALSFPYALTPIVIRLLWLILTAIAIVAAIRRVSCARRGLARPLPDLLLPWRRDKFVTGVCVVVALVTLLVALLGSPNTWDAQTYHLPRVMFWQQAETLRNEFYSDSRIVFMPPLAEYAILHFHLLAGSDRFDNCVQWLSGVVSMIGIVGIARLLGMRGRRGSWGAAMAALFTATNPMGILQMSSVQTDSVITAYVVAFVWLGMILIRRMSWRMASWQAIALGLAVLTKQTAVFFAAPFAVWFTLARFIKRPNVGIVYAMLVIAITLALNAPHQYRVRTAPNYTDEVIEKNANQRIGADVIISNFIRLAGLHLSTLGMRQQMQDGIVKIHEMIGIAANDPKTTAQNEFVLKRYSTHEDMAGSPIHLIVAFVASLGVLLFPRAHASARGERRRLWLYSLCVAMGLFIMLVVLMWSPYRHRYHLTMFVLCGPIVGAALRSWMQAKWLQTVVVVLFIGWAIPPLFVNATRPLIPLERFQWTRTIWQADRVRQLDASHKGRHAASYPQVTDALAKAGVRTIGLFRGKDDFEYPLWVLAQRKIPGVRIVHRPVAESIAPIPGIDARLFIGEFKEYLSEHGKLPADAQRFENMVLVIDRSPHR